MRGQRGVSATEVMVAVAIAAVTATLALPRAFGGNNTALTYTRAVSTELQQARFRAIASHRSHVIVVTPRRVSVHQDSRETPALAVLSVPGNVSVFGLEARQVQDTATAPTTSLTDTGTEIVLHPSGRVGDDGAGFTIFVGDKNRRDRRWRIVISGLTGHVRVVQGLRL